jgi:hypothetical protein
MSLYDWSKAPEWAKWAAQGGETGFFDWYENKPICVIEDSGKTFWKCDEGKHKCEIAQTELSDVGAANSLEERPKNIDLEDKDYEKKVTSKNDVVRCSKCERVNFLGQICECCKIQIEIPKWDDLEKPKKKSSGDKYLRIIRNRQGKELGEVDVYCALRAFGVNEPALAHAAKKILCAGIRGKGDERQDLEESIDAIQAALDALPLD